MFKRRISAKFARLVVGLFVSVFLCATPAFAGNLSEVQAIYDRLIYDSQNIDDDDFFDDNQWQVIDTSQYVTGVVGNNADQAEHTVGKVGVRGPDLGSVEHIVSAIAHSAQLQRCQVRSRTRL